MNTKAFNQPQRQSAVGILVIFSRVAYKFLKSFWVLLILLFFSNPDSIFSFYARLILPALIILGILYSYFYYRRFWFYIDYANEEFVLSKGVFSTDSVKIPFDKIQQVDLKRTILQRIIGVYSVAVDTAGSKGDEIHIRALTKDSATALSSILTKAKNEKGTSGPENPQTEPLPGKKAHKEKSWIHHVNLGTLLKIGLTRSYLRGFLLMLVFILTLYNQLQGAFKSYFESIEGYSKSFLNAPSQNLVFFIFLVVLVFLLSILVTVGEVIIKHFDLNLRQTPAHLEIEMGLKTNTKVALQPRRLQRLEIRTNPVQKWLNLYELQFSLASSQNNLDKSQIRVPGLTPRFIEKIQSFLYADTANTSGKIKLFRPVKRWLVRRFLLSGIPFLAGWLIEGIGFHFYDWGLVFLLSTGYLAGITAYQYFLYKTIILELSDEFLVLKHGLWTQKKEIIELYKMEGVSMRQPFYYRNADIFNLTFHTAGGDVSLRAINRNVLTEMNYVLYKIESAQRVWM